MARDARAADNCLPLSRFCFFCAVALFAGAIERLREGDNEPGDAHAIARTSCSIGAFQSWRGNPSAGAGWDRKVDAEFEALIARGDMNYLSRAVRGRRGAVCPATRENFVIPRGRST